jgi:hypothetical protein
MSWDLGSKKYDMFPQVDEGKLFSTITHYQAFCYYIDSEVKLGEAINSPLRQDNIPSFALFKNKFSGEIMYKDFATGDSGGVIKFVMLLKGVSYREALHIIACDFNYVNESSDAKNKRLAYTKLKTPKIRKVEIGIRRRPWKTIDKEYWGQYGITRRTLEKFWVSPVQYLFFNDTLVRPEKHCYAYKEVKDGKVSFKILQPYGDYKWINNANDSIHQGYRQLPEKGELLIITKSLKDVMSLHDVASIPAIGLQAESVSVKKSVMYEYKDRFDRVICLFDNDEPGRRFSARFSSEFDIEEIFMPQDMGKDFSDVVKNYGAEEALEVLTEITY